MTLRELREAAKLTQVEAARIAAVDQTTVSALELGKKSNCELDTLRGLAKAYGCPIGVVLEALEASVQEAAA